ncbi:Transglutaminase-like superfamily protein [Pirellula sp. SH-Sr6A]|uniref:transglutaminase-like domain-containing protein n=1 Tax=Pirellula sp. SH-Sr6A TaxID=1632865 RepID=UPI00078D1857|nr:transglutaminase domain-containing protein [Pirellula sp. SH-Sr6A]AMV33065.1 Transglutaminase-like superfamily protein [Pirellula sp. SH-Sr6A]
MNLAQHDQTLHPSGDRELGSRAEGSSKPNKTEFVRRRSKDRGDLQSNQIKGRRASVVLMALIAIWILALRRWEYESPWIMVLESVLGGSLLAVAVWIRKKLASRYSQGEWCRSASLDTKQSTDSHWQWYRKGVTALVTFAVVMPWVVDPVARGLGYGNGIEIVMLSSLLWGAVACSLMATTTRMLGLSVVCSGFLTLFTTFISDDLTTTWFAYAWGAVCLWWLVSNHWEKVEQSAAYDIQFGWGQRLAFLSLGCIAFGTGAILIADRIPVLRKLRAEVMPTSGGTSGKDSSAQRGIGNGDQLVAARSRPSSFGAVDTDLFLDSDKPSLFDLFSDEFGDVKKKDRVEQTQALNPNEIQDQEGNVSEANQSPKGGEFSIERKVPDQRSKTEDIASNAVMFWQGAANSHLAVERLDRFDGEVWQSSLSTERNGVRVEPKEVEIDGQLWFAPGTKRMESSISPFVGAVPEAIRFTRYGSPVIPTRSGTQLWCIDDITRADFFHYGMDDCLSMPGREHVPDYTIVRLIHSWIDLERVEDLLENCAPGRSHTYLPVECKSTIHRLAHRYAGRNPRGWNQVQGVVQGVRENFRLGTETEKGSVSDISSSALDRFLKNGHGPSYLFPTATALMLEHLGYETRLVTGFYARSKNVFGAEKDIAILPNDVHVWLEIHAGHGYWIPLEPTPGYHEPSYTASLRYRLYQARWWILYGLLATGLLGSLIYVSRSMVFEAAILVLSPFLPLLRDRARIEWTAWLLDTRAWLAGHPRRHGTVPKAHFRELSSMREGLGSALTQFFRASDRICFGGASTMDRYERQALQTLWTRLTTRRIQTAFRKTIG